MELISKLDLCPLMDQDDSSSQWSLLTLNITTSSLSIFSTPTFFVVPEIPKIEVLSGLSSNLLNLHINHAAKPLDELLTPHASCYLCNADKWLLQLVSLPLSLGKSLLNVGDHKIVLYKSLFSHLEALIRVASFVCQRTNYSQLDQTCSQLCLAS